MDTIWYFVGTYLLVSLTWIIIEIKKAPMMKDDYGVTYKEDKDEDQYKKGFYNGKTNKWIKNK